MLGHDVRMILREQREPEERSGRDVRPIQRRVGVSNSISVCGESTSRWPSRSSRP
jgi:hypothetical protein